MQGKIMIQGTASSAGKSLLCAALCRIFREDGYRVAPFKSQNMALNSAVTADGLEMGRAQVMQAEAAGLPPRVEMNPLLLKPTSDRGSQVVVMGRPVGNMEAGEYLRWKDKLWPVIDEAYATLAAETDIIVIEGAGSPAEINLKEQDIVNMGLARRLGAPVLLVGDIDRGGVFAALYGTVALLEAAERRLLRGVIINKFRGDPAVLSPGLDQLRELVDLPVVGVIPYLHFNLDDEDSLSGRFGRLPAGRALQVRVVKLPRLANYTDFNPLELYGDVDLTYIDDPALVPPADLLILPGSKNTSEDLLYLREQGWPEAIGEYLAAGGLLMGICGGFQMLGREIRDPRGVESSHPVVSGLGLLDMETVMAPRKETRQVRARWCHRDEGFFRAMVGEELLEGYEIHMGQTSFGPVCHPMHLVSSGGAEGAVRSDGLVFGTYLHGIFDNFSWTGKLLDGLRARRGLPPGRGGPQGHYRQVKEGEYSRLAGAVRQALDMDLVYRVVAAGGPAGDRKERRK